MTAANGRRDGRELSGDRFDGVVMDLDGVITDTAGVHAAAWKSTFDPYLAQQGCDHLFDPVSDYRRYVDGKPRFEGVRSFLEARGLSLPYGDPADAPDQKTICGLGNRKNQLFQENLRTDGARVYPSSIAFVHALRAAGLPVAVASSSRNCAVVLAAAGIADLFEARVDGLELDRLGLAGKPAPDMFIEASRRLGTEPARTVGIEDASAGVEALKAGGFGWVIGVGTGDQAEILRSHGADLVVGSLDELEVVAPLHTATTARLPDALARLEEMLAGREPVVFLDYDGTLTPIVDDPDAAVLDEAMADTLRRLSALCDVAIVSGRDLADVKAKVGLPDLWYAGSHGFDIAGPQGQREIHEAGKRYLPLLDRAEQALRDRLARIDGCLIERKHFAVAVHYRRVSEADLGRVRASVQEVHAAVTQLRLAEGKKLYEFQPDIDWHKGRALAWLMDALQLDRDRVKPLYIGDDVTDEDAFRELATAGAGIVVAADDKATLARYRLEDPAAVKLFLARLCDRIEETRR